MAKSQGAKPGVAAPTTGAISITNSFNLQARRTLWCRNRQDSNEYPDQELLCQRCIDTRINSWNRAAAVIPGFHGGGRGERGGQGCCRRPPFRRSSAAGSPREAVPAIVTSGAGPVGRI